MEKRRKTNKQNSKIVNQNTFKSIHLPFFIFRFIKFHTKRKNILSTITQRNSYMYLWNKKYKTKQIGYTICHTHNHACICSIYKAALTTKQKQQRQLTLYIQLVINMSKTILIGRPNTKILWWIKDLILVILNYLCHFDWLQVLRDEIWKWNDYRCNELLIFSLRPKLR